MGLKQLLIDVWSPLNYKPVYNDGDRGMPHRRAFPEAAATWVPPADERRLAAYKLLAAYDKNQAGELAEFRDGPEARDRREFGDPSMYIEAILAHVLGREQRIVVPGAEQASDEQSAEAKAAARVEELLTTWAKDELLTMRVIQCERKSVSLGDGVYLLNWDPAKRRARCRVYDPGLYFPVLPEDGDADFPTRVHLAWELPEDKVRRLKPRLRRITYELDWIGPATASGITPDGRPVRAPVLTDPTDDVPAQPVLGLGDTIDPASGTILRQYPWNDEPTAYTCYLTDATWNLEDLKYPHDVDNLPLDKAVFGTGLDGEVLDRLDLMIDFIPVIHIPNTVPEAEEHWGQSSLLKPLQIFDEIAGTDTDSSKASATTGSPLITVSGRPASNKQAAMTINPGQVIEVGENGRMDVLNTAPMLAELRNHAEYLGDRAATITRLPAVALGTTDPSKVPSGYALEISLGPLDALIGAMRLARAHKYRLLLKFVQRLHIAGQHPDWIGVTPLDAEYAFGPYTPADKAAVLTQVSEAFKAGVISLETAVRMLREAGWPIEDIEDEITRIQARRFEDARALADATGSTKAVGNYLGIDINPDPTPPTPQLPPGNPVEEDDEDEEDDEETPA
ncbi:hypothetical protein [Streptomyces cinereoruber]|uniref:hypothetical protein n=1 Tax=Streptomyces cinereoruber TaxID=67260 RepID=UPI00363F27D6